MFGSIFILAAAGQIAHFAGATAGVLFVALVIFLIIAAIGTIIKELGDADLLDPLEAGAEEPLVGEKRERFERALKASVPKELNDGHFAHYSDILFAKDRLAEIKSFCPTARQDVERVNLLAGEIKLCLGRHYLLWESGSLGKALIILAFVVGVVCLVKAPFWAGFTLIPLGFYFLWGRTPMFVAMNECWVDQLLTKITAVGMTMTAAMLPLSLTFTETRWVYVDTNIESHRDTEWSGFPAVIIALVLAVVSMMLLSIRMIMLGLRNYVLYR